MPGAGSAFVSEQQRGVAVRANDTESRAGIAAAAVAGGADQGHGKTRFLPPVFQRIPQSRFAGLVVSDDDIEVAVVVQIEQPNAVVLAVGRAERLSEQQVLIESLLCLAKIEELHFASVLCDGVIKQFDELIVSDPAMRMKNGETLPAYNVVAGSEGQFIINCSVHQTTNDGACFKQHLEQLEKHSEVLPDAIIADSIFGTEENYELLENKNINNYLKFPSFYKEGKKSYQNNPFLKDNFIYDGSTDTYTCPNDQLLVLTQITIQTHKRTGYKSTLKIYACENCSGCPFYAECCRAQTEKNRIIKVNEKLEVYKQQARKNLKTEKGITLRKQRGIEIESCFGDIKHNMGFRRFHVRGIEKVKAEWSIVAMAHNLKKIHLQNIKKAA